MIFFILETEGVEVVVETEIGTHRSATGEIEDKLQLLGFSLILVFFYPNSSYAVRAAGFLNFSNIHSMQKKSVKIQFKNLGTNLSLKIQFNLTLE